MDDDRKQRLVAIRRPPPPFERVKLVERRELSPRMWRLTFEGDCLRRLGVDQPGTSVRFVVPWPGAELELPDWNGNEFLLSGGSRPALRTFTPLRPDARLGRLDLEIVRHPGGAVSDWAERAPLGSPAAVSGPGAGYEFPADAERLLVLGDETAIPAIGQLAEMAPDRLALQLHVEVIRDDAVLDLRLRPQDTIEWHVTPAAEHPGGRIASVVEAIDDLADGTYLWAAGEASAMQRIRNHVFKTIGTDRGRATVRGYWKPAPETAVSSD
jgi:NADPH-dependent ferric siderophore reductase